MRKTNPLKQTLVIIPIAIVLTFVCRYLFSLMAGYSMHPALTLVTYIIMFAALKLASEKMVDRGKLSWLVTEEN